MHNLANHSGYRTLRAHLSRMLTRELEALGDPRETGQEVLFDHDPYHADYGVERASPPQSVMRALDLINSSRGY